MRGRSVAALAALALLAACGQGQDNSASPADTPQSTTARYAYNLTEDVAGDYAPLETVQVQNWTLQHIFVAGPHVFESWIGGERQLMQSPVSMVFSDEKGTLTVAPGRFDISDNHFRFSGSSPATGDYDFEGRIDLDALATARRTLGSEETVLKGRLQIGGQTFNALALKIKTGG